MTTPPKKPTALRYSIRLPDGSIVPTREAARMMGLSPSSELIRIWDKEEAKE